MEGSICEVLNIDEVPHIVKGNDFETLIVVSMQNVVKKEVFRLVQQSAESEIMKEIFEKLFWNLYLSLLTKIRSIFW